MAKVSAGLVMYRLRSGQIEVLLVHPGGPFFAQKDNGAWSIPKGIVAEGEAPLDAARREFREETGLEAAGPFLDLAPVRQRSGKLVYAWAFEGDADPTAIQSNTFTLEWPPGSGQQRTFPEVDRAGFFGPEAARVKINPAQVAFLEELAGKVRRS